MFNALTSSRPRGVVAALAASPAAANLSLNPFDAQLDELLQVVFPRWDGQGFSPDRQPLSFSTLHAHVQCIVDAAHSSAVPELPLDGLIGGDRAVQLLDRAAPNLAYTLDDAGLTLESQCQFASLSANACVAWGRWMFEVTLMTAGIQQLGWWMVASDAAVTHTHGVGDVPHSYAYDGKRVRRWNGGSSAYGEAWMPWDVVGCCIDLDVGEVSFTRNGHALGVAFTGLLRGRDVAYFPAVSLSRGEMCKVNFGATPLAFPVAGFRAMAQGPAQTIGRQLLRGARVLVGLASSVSGELPVQAVMPAIFWGDVRWWLAPSGAAASLPSLPVEHVPVAGRVVLPFIPVILGQCWAALSPHLAPLLTAAEHVELLLLPYLLQAPPLEVNIFLGNIAAFICTHDFEIFLTLLLKALSLKNLQILLAEPRRLQLVTAATSLLQHPAVFPVAVALPQFWDILQGFFGLRCAGPHGAAQMMPHVWWPEAPANLASQQGFKLSVGCIEVALGGYIQEQHTLMRLLLERGPVPDIKQWVERLIVKHVDNRRQPQTTCMPTGPFLINLADALFDFVNVRAGPWLSAVFPPNAFSSRTVFSRCNFPCIGGLVSVVHAELAGADFSPDHDAPDSNADFHFWLLDRSVLLTALSLLRLLRHMRQGWVRGRGAALPPLCRRCTHAAPTLWSQHARNSRRRARVNASQLLVFAL